MARFVRVFSEAEQRFYWADGEAFEAKRQEAEKARIDFREKLGSKPMTLDECQDYVARMFPEPVEFEIVAPRPPKRDKEKNESETLTHAISCAWLRRHYGEAVFKEMIDLRIIELIPGVNACVADVPRRYIADDRE